MSKDISQKLQKPAASPLFMLLFYGGTLMLTLLVTPLLISHRTALMAGHLWGVYVRFMCRLCGLNYQLSGLPDHTDDKEPAQVIYAVKHQSAWETMVLFSLLNHPAVVLKKELMAIPVMGWFFARAGNIPVDRKAGMAALKKLQRQAKEAADQGRSILIYPQGTRVSPGQEAPYQIGVFALYQGAELPVVPVALNSGLFWPKNALGLNKGVVQVSCLPPIEPGLPRKTFMTRLEEAIETETKRLGG